MIRIIIIIIYFLFIIGCQNIAAPDYDIVVGPYKYDDADLIWKYCSYGRTEPSDTECGMCHYIYYQ